MLVKQQQTQQETEAVLVRQRESVSKSRAEPARSMQRLEAKVHVEILERIQPSSFD